MHCSALKKFGIVIASKSLTQTLRLNMKLNFQFRLLEQLKMKTVEYLSSKLIRRKI